MQGYMNSRVDCCLGNVCVSRGLYSSSDALVTGQQMDDMRNAGIEEVAVSWWGQGSPEDRRLPEVDLSLPRRM